MKMNVSDVGTAANASAVRYGLCWEDADVLTQALALEEHHACLSIAAAGDNTLALLAFAPRSVVAIDMNKAQLACLALRVAAYRVLDDAELRAFFCGPPTHDRARLYTRCRPLLAVDDRAFWDARPRVVAAGIAGCGKFETYLTTFRRCVLPLVHDRAEIASLLTPKTRSERERYFEQAWNTPLWRALFRAFFCRPVMSRLGRDPRFFAHVESDIATHLFERARHALVELDPSTNPYLHWILTGSYGEAVPFALRTENIGRIRAHLDRLSWRHCSLDEFLAAQGDPIDRFALSDIFEYVDADEYATLLGRIVGRSARGARLAYWNMLVERTRPERLAGLLVPDRARATQLHAHDRAFFYRRFVIEDVR